MDGGGEGKTASGSWRKEAGEELGDDGGEVARRGQSSWRSSWPPVVGCSVSVGALLSWRGIYVGRSGPAH